jgi:hypothetical protein
LHPILFYSALLAIDQAQDSLSQPLHYLLAEKKKIKPEHIINENMTRSTAQGKFTQMQMSVLHLNSQTFICTKSVLELD